MIIARGVDEKNKLNILIIGLSAKNVERLQKGLFSVMTAANTPGIPEGWRVDLVYEQTDEALVQQFLTAGAVTVKNIKPDGRLE